MFVIQVFIMIARAADICKHFIELLAYRNLSVAFFLIWINFNLAWLSNYIHYKVCDEITYPLLNFNDCNVEVQEWISIFIPHFTKQVITFPYWDKS